MGTNWIRKASMSWKYLIHILSSVHFVYVVLWKPLYNFLIVRNTSIYIFFSLFILVFVFINHMERKVLRLTLTHRKWRNLHKYFDTSKKESTWWMRGFVIMKDTHVNCVFTVIMGTSSLFVGNSHPYFYSYFCSLWLVGFHCGLPNIAKLTVTQN